jgi:N utilization substance protein B
MGKRRKAREYALQILFQLEFDDSQPETDLAKFWQGRQTGVEEREYADNLVLGIMNRRAEIDDVIQSVSQNWKISRMVLVDRNVLRIAVYELKFGEGLAPAIAINEAIEIAKKFSCDQSATFINGILDAVRKKMTQEELPKKDLPDE